MGWNFLADPVLAGAVAVIPVIALGGVLKNFVSSLLSARCQGLKTKIVGKLRPLRTGIRSKLAEVQAGGHGPSRQQQDSLKLFGDRRRRGIHSDSGGAHR